jgi:ParB-like chromosome segregation protein Spo0J
MWMGGVAPLGYKADGRSLAIVNEHAVLVRHIFGRYLTLGNVRLLADELKQQGRVVPHRTTISGKSLGGGSFSRGQLYHILSRIIYIGEIAHKDATYPGTHPPIIERELFAKVQQLLADNTAGTRKRRAATASLLAGKLFDAEGEPLVAVHTLKGKVKYRYYVSRALHHKLAETGMRIPARELEAMVVARLAEALQDPLQLISTAWLNVPADEMDQYARRCDELKDSVRGKDKGRVAQLIHKAQIQADRVLISCHSSELAAALKTGMANPAHRFSLEAQGRLARSGRTMRLIQGGAAAKGEIDQSLVKLLIRARTWWAELREGKLDVAAIARRDGITESYVSRVLRLAFVAPAVLEAILAGEQSAAASARRLVKWDAIDELWSKQELRMLTAVRLRELELV